MDHGLCNVIYLDRRAQETGAIKRDRLQVDNAGYFDVDEVKPNISAVLSTFNEVFVCADGVSCLRKINELDDPLNTTPTIVLIEIPYEDSSGRKRSRDVRTPSPTASRRTAVERDEPEDVYGFHMLSHLSTEIQQRCISKMIVPVAVLSGVNPRPTSAAGAMVSPSLPGARVLADPARMARFVDAGAVDVLTSPLSKDRIQGLAVHAYRMFKEVSKESSTFALSKRNRKLSWVGINEERPYAYLREAMVSGLMDGICNPELLGDYIDPNDLSLTAERKQAVSDAVGSWSFSAHAFNTDELLYAALLILQHALQMPELERWRMSTDELTTFLLACRRAYNDFVLYHNFRHVVDVLQAIFYFLLQIGTLPPYPTSKEISESEPSPVGSLLKPFDALTLLISAIGHDVGHPGVNNAFLVALNAPLAQLYNDRSVLEAFHCAAYSQILRRYWPEAFSDIGMRKLMINSILATDMGLHFRYMSDMGNLQEKLAHSKNTLDGWSPKMLEETKDLACGLLIKCADISNVARKYNVAAQWAVVLTDEFANQGAMEKELNLPTCLFGGPPDRDDLIKLGESQIGFMNIFARPLFEGVTDIFPTMEFSIAEMGNNKAIWEGKIDAERTKRGSQIVDTRSDRPEPSPLTRSPITQSATSVQTFGSRSTEEADIPPLPSASAFIRPQPFRNVSDEGNSVKSQAQGPPGDQDSAKEEASRRASRGSRRTSSNALPYPAHVYTQYAGSSRRSSKDAALDQLEQLQLGQLSTFSRIENQSIPVSRRGSADASLTTIYVSSQQGDGGAPSPTKANSPSKRGSRPPSQPQQAGARFSVPSSRSHATSSATAATTQPHSPSTQASSITDAEGTPTGTVEPPPVLATENPFLPPNISPDLDVREKEISSSSDVLTVPDVGPGKTNMFSRVTSNESSSKADSSESAPHSNKEPRDLRESRSRSRLRGLRFWRKRHKSFGLDGEESA